MQVSRYRFYHIFSIDEASGSLKPQFNVMINGVYVHKGDLIPRGAYFGGLDLYSVQGRSIAGTWLPVSKTLSIEGFY